MMLVRQIFETAFDSPTYIRDRSNMVSGLTVGLTGLLLNGGILLFVFPFLLSNKDGFDTLLDYVEFGQLVAFVLLCGLTIFGTVFIPLRLATVFWEPRLSRYFDQIILSGITPLRFVIGKALSQNLFLGLMLFLLIPYLTLSLTLGGVHFGFFLSGLFLVWLYCITLALTTLWLSLYLNELLAALSVIVLAGILCGTGCYPMIYQPFVMTPLPTLLYPLYQSSPELRESVAKSYWSPFLASTICLVSLMVISCFAIWLGPLYGIIRENCMFGEVVRAGDTKRKRLFRIRHHIQRPSELAFFYANRSTAFLRNEGMLRWSLSMASLLMLLAAGYYLAEYVVRQELKSYARNPNIMYQDTILAFIFTIHGIVLAAACILFSHTKNTTFLRIPFIMGRRIEVAHADTIFFLSFAIISTVAALVFAIHIEETLLLPNQLTLFTAHQQLAWNPTRKVDFVRAFLEGLTILTVCGFVVYSFQRLLCMSTWVRSISVCLVAMLYLFLVIIGPIASAAILHDGWGIQLLWMFRLSPAAALIELFGGQLSPSGQANSELTTVPFYVGHTILFLLFVLLIKLSARRLRKQYLEFPAKGDSNV